VADKPVTWFQGLIAERTAAFAPSAMELPLIERQIARSGQPVLDLGCGTGRLLLPLLPAGVDIDGADVSGDMLRHCRERAAVDSGDTTRNSAAIKYCVPGTPLSESAQDRGRIEGHVR
jgi:SAM-dependent methyltransferase